MKKMRYKWNGRQQKKEEKKKTTTPNTYVIDICGHSQVIRLAVR